ncbi:Structural maintenance of chromosomes protein [Gracilaria domingensis]|nr:Structural maintenance of chromosomes protein [Gracilaria domingensis]
MLPGPRMNLIIGPNGTGKSSVANAVCIVFGGHPRLLGRSTDLGGFVKHGTQEACVTALIFDDSIPSGVRQVRRKFDTDGKNEFFLDGTRCTMSKVLSDVCQRYDIQLDNLSQFMPQEKIAEFVNMQPHELLEITIRALGGTEKSNLYQRLKTVDKQISSADQDLASLQERLDTLREQQEANAEEVAAFKEQQMVRKRLELYRRYMLCAEEEYARERYAAMLKERKEMEAAINQLKQQLSDASAGPINAKRQILDAARQTLKSAKGKSMSQTDPLKQLNEDVEKTNAELRARQNEYKDVEHRAEQLKKAVSLAQTKYERAVEQRQQIGDVKIPLLDSKIKEIDEKRYDVRNDITRLHEKSLSYDRERSSSSRNIKIANHQLQEIADVRHARIDTLSRWKRKPLDKCAEVVQNLVQKRVFQGHVYGPVGAEIEVRNEYHGRILEHLMRGDFFITAFVTETMRDANVLLDECQKALGFRPHVFTAPTTADDEPDMYAIQQQVPARPVDDTLRSMGIVDVVSNIYSAPAAVRAALNAQLNLHNVHVGMEGAATQRSIDGLKWEDGVVAWYTPKARMGVIKSRYDRNVRNLSMDNSFENQSGRFFAESLFAQEQKRQHLINQIREEEGRMENAGKKVKDIMERIKELEQVKRDLESERREKERRKAEAKRIEDLVRALERQVKQAQERAANHDVNRLKKRVTTQMGQLEDEVVDLALRMTAALEQQVEAVGQYDDAMIDVGCAARDLAKEQEKHESSVQEIAAQEAAYKDKRAEEKACKAEYKNKMERARGAITEEDWGEHGEELNALHQIEPAELEEKIAQMEGQAQGLETGGDGIIRSFEERQKKIENLENELEDRKQRHGARRERMLKEKKDFLLWLDKGVQKMRTKFSSLYQRLGCSGDLELVNGQRRWTAGCKREREQWGREDVLHNAVLLLAGCGGGAGTAVCVRGRAESGTGPEERDEDHEHDVRGRGEGWGESELCDIAETAA